MYNTEKMDAGEKINNLKKLIKVIHDIRENSTFKGL